MQYSLSTLRRKAHEAGYSFQKGYQRYWYNDWGYVRTRNGERIIGYQILDYRSGSLSHASIQDGHNYAMELNEATALLKELCAERGVAF